MSYVDENGNIKPYPPDHYNTRVQDKVDQTGSFYNKSFKRTEQYWPVQNENLDTYIRRIARAVGEALEANYHTHINGPRGPWYTHRRGGDCFMCNDAQFIRILRSALLQISEHSDLSQFFWTFSPETSEWTLVRQQR